MSEWLKDHALEILSLLTSLIGVKCLIDFWNEICRIFTESTAPAVFISVLPLAFGALISWWLVRRWARKEIEKLGGEKRTMDSLFREYAKLTRDDQRSVVDVYLSEPRGLEPTDEQRRRMGDWVKMNDFLRHDPVTDTLHLKDDSVRKMLLENPEHVYDLMAACVADLQSQLEECGKGVQVAKSESNASDKPNDRGGSDSLRGQVRTPSGVLATNLAAIDAFSPDMAAAAIETFDSNGAVPFGPFESTVRKSVDRHDGVFSIDTYWFMGSSTGEETGKYRLTERWRDFLDDVDVLSAMRKRAERSSVRMAEVAKQVVREEIVPISKEEIEEAWNKAMSGGND